MEFSFTRKLQVSLIAWSNPAEEELSYAYWDSPCGRVSLLRASSRRTTPEALANKHENWTVDVEGEAKARFYDAAAPGFLLHRRLHQGLTAEVCGMPCKVSAKRSVRPGQRFVLLKFSDSTLLRFEKKRTRVQLVDTGGNILAKRHSGRWSGKDDRPVEFAAICLFELGELDVFLRSPIIDLF